MRICHVITRLIVGGAQENTLLTCRGLVERGHEVSLVVGPETGPEGSMHEQARATGAEVVVVDSMRRAVNPWRDWAAIADLRDALTTLKPEIVHTHSSKAGVLARAAARDLSVPIVVHSIHGMSFNRTQSAPIRWLFANLERHCAAFTDAYICVADAMTQQSVDAGVAPADRFTTVRSGIEIEQFDPTRYDRQAVRERLGIAPGAVVIATIARLFKNKGYEVILPAAVAAGAMAPGLEFVWIGDGPGRAGYERELARLEMGTRVHLTGLVPPEQVPELLAASDILVHASRWEGLPRAAVQALLLAKPVVCFNVDGAREVVIDGITGRLVPLDDAAGLANAMVELATDAALRDRMGQAGREHCLGPFDWRTMVDQIEHVYFELAARRGLAGGP